MPAPPASPAIADDRSIGVTVFEPALATNANLPSGAMAMAIGSLPTSMAPTGVCVARSIAVTVPADAFATNALRPSGAIASVHGVCPAAIGSPMTTWFVVSMALMESPSVLAT